MLRIKKLIRNIFNLYRGISKRAYTCGMIVVAATFVTIMVMGANGFDGKGRVVAYARTEVNDSGKETVPPLVNEEIFLLHQATTLIEELSQPTCVDSEDVVAESKELAARRVVTKETVYAMTRTKEVEQAPDLVRLVPDSTIQISTEDYEALARIVEAESGAEEIQGCIMVANVILNRVKSPKFPNTIYEVIHQEVNGVPQFYPVASGFYEKVKVQQSTYEAVDRALAGEDYSNGGLYFVTKTYAESHPNSWFEKHLERVAVFDNQVFYK